MTDKTREIILLNRLFRTKAVEGGEFTPTELMQARAAVAELTEDEDRICYSLLMDETMKRYPDLSLQFHQNFSYVLQDNVQKAVLDQLTGIPNRLMFFEQYPNVQALNTRENYNVPDNERTFIYLFSMDLADFKRINDEHGHAAGDKALRHFADLVRDVIRPNDFLARFGGDEFNAFLPGTDLKTAGLISHRITEKCKTTPFEYEGKQLYVLPSIGVTRVNETLSLEENLKHGDKVLESSKALQKEKLGIVTMRDQNKAALQFIPKG